MKILKNILLIVVSLVVAYFLSPLFLKLYSYISPISAPDGFFAPYEGMAQYLMGAIFGVILIFVLLFTAFGDKHKYYWFGVILLPVLWFVIKFDLTHWYFYLTLAVAGWVVGWGIGKLFSRSKNSQLV